MPLPIASLLDEIKGSLEETNRLLLIAPPGAGKTTYLPLALRCEPWVEQRRIIILEPRRLAARAAAYHMAQSLGEKLGETVGLRTRFDSFVSSQTSIEVVTEGIFSRMILEDPFLEQIAMVIFDEFHERSLEADLGLALALDCQEEVRSDLKILLMSATLEGERLLQKLPSVRKIESAGRLYPVETAYKKSQSHLRLEEEMASLTLDALQKKTGSLLVFLPGQAEIQKTAALLKERSRETTLDIIPLYAGRDRDQQEAALLPAREGRRKVVLATSIAETSLTIEGIHGVIDSGFARLPRYEPELELTRLETVRVSRAQAEQRRGRAGRTQAGFCWRLGEERRWSSLVPAHPASILNSDLSGLVLDLLEWGKADPLSLFWLDPPPLAALTQARNTLRRLGALDEKDQLTEMGRVLRRLPLPPRLARMVLYGAAKDQAELAASLAMVLGEPGLGGSSSDLERRVENLQQEKGRREKEARRLALIWARKATKLLSHSPGIRNILVQKSRGPLTLARLLISAYPDRVARARGHQGLFLLANGRAASLPLEDPLSTQPWLSIVDLSGQAIQARILSASALTFEDIEEELASQFREEEEISFDVPRKALQIHRTCRLGALILWRHPCTFPKNEEAAASLFAEGLSQEDLQGLPWTPSLRNFCTRVCFLHHHSGEPWPDLSLARLTAQAQDWLVPLLQGKVKCEDIKASEFEQVLRAFLPWPLAQKLEEEAPAVFKTPRGSSFLIDYEAEQGPSIYVRVQELYGLSRHPSLTCAGIPLTLHLLSPAQRVFQIIKDLPRFWKEGWASVRIEMKGRYPKHHWPENPLL